MQQPFLFHHKQGPAALQMIKMSPKMIFPATYYKGARGGAGG
jgi:hypothetical protein